MSEETSKPNMATPVAIVIAGIFIAGAVLLSNSGANPINGTSGTTTTTPTVPGQQAAPTGNTIFNISVDDDPIKGDPNAPITIVELSDYECPFCQRAFSTTYPILMSEYVDTGKARYVFRDFPLTEIHPNAMGYAIAANCAREQGGDEAYFNYHDRLFTRATAGALNTDALTAMATEMGLNGSQFTSCMSKEEHVAEVNKDMQDGNVLGQATMQAMGRSIGTPTFIIGKTTEDGNIEGQIVVGAQDISAFKAILDNLN